LRKSRGISLGKVEYDLAKWILHFPAYSITLNLLTLHSISRSPD
jgi:hypothetical protein